MKIHKLLLTTLMLAAFALGAMAQQRVELPLWPNGAPNDNGDATDTAKVIVFLPNPHEATGRAVVLCPGGGYGYRSMDSEGTDWAPYFNRLGVAAIVLHYRLPHAHSDVPLTDAQEALRLVRRHAAEWHLRPDQVGVMGFSAGGHLAASVATMSADDARPDFQILIYPVISMIPGQIHHQGSHDNLLGLNPGEATERAFSCDRRVTDKTPRAFIALADDDGVVPPANGVGFYLALKRYHIPATLHVYPSGGHGFGIRESFKYHAELELALAEWLRTF